MNETFSEENQGNAHVPYFSSLVHVILGQHYFFFLRTFYSWAIVEAPNCESIPFCLNVREFEVTQSF